MSLIRVLVRGNGHRPVPHIYWLPAVELELGSIIHSLSSAETWERYPEATAKLLIYLADQNLPAWQWYGARELIENLIKGDLPDILKENLKEVLAKLGL